MVKCIPVDSVPTIVDRILTQAGATRTLKQKVTQSFSDLQYIDGQVSAIKTEAGKQLIFVTDVPANKAASFEFPPNQKVFQDELIRAQDNGRIVSVVFRNNPQKGNVIDDIWVYAGSAVSSPRY
ncbi:MAG: hypothetical protein WCE54_15055 [Ignavibacteriaceae bacterium]